MKIAVFGNCQRGPIVKALQMLNRDIYAEDMEATADFDAAIKLADHDVICAQLNLPQSIQDYIVKSGKKLIFYPRITFAAFQPDATFINKVGGSMILTALSGYHSNLAFFGWQNGLRAEETIKLFTGEVFDMVGYYDDVAPASQALLKEGLDSGMPLDELLGKWLRTGCFMHTFNHPKQSILIDIARQVLKQLAVSCDVDDPEPFLMDPLINSVVWPVYPEIASRLSLGAKGNYYFKTSNSTTRDKYSTVLSLQDMVKNAYEVYSAYEPHELWCPRVQSVPFRNLLVEVGRGLVGRLGRKPVEKSSVPSETKGQSARQNPYSTLPPYQFWRKAIETVAMSDVDPVIRGAFQIKKSEKVATAGSCFAQHISRTLSNSGFDYYIPEQAEAGVPVTEASRRNYGVFSARFGNIYTTRQLVQLFDRAYGAFTPEEDAWVRPDGRFVDPFRPQIEPDGFETVADLRASRESHLGAVRDMFEKLDILVFTLGLTEGWRSKQDGAVFPLAPGVSGGQLDLARHEFINFTAAEVTDDLNRFLAKLKSVNPNARVILTVSPVPLIATYENRHVLVSNTYSKAALRVAAEEAAQGHDNVTYFPSFEIIVGNYNHSAYYEADLRSVRPEGVAHVMRLFMQHYSDEAAKRETPLLPSEGLDARTQELLKQRDIVCDEEEIMSWSRT